MCTLIVPVGAVSDYMDSDGWSEFRQIKNLTVTFESDGGSDVPSQPVNYAATTPQPAPPVKKWYTFLGWFKDAGRTQPWDFAVETLVSDTTLYAKWEGNKYTLTFDAQGGTVNPDTCPVNYDAAVGDLPTPVRVGYTFEGWYTSANGGGTRYEKDSIYSITADTSLYANWTVNTYTLSFDAQGGTVSPDTCSVTYDAAVGDLPTPVRVGYTFEGW
jgi:uncharacterized repeat protein (TIGR02543 family)